MGVFDSACSKCGSKEHSSESCPHGFFSSKCSHCGSVDHSSSQCPHGIFSSKCSNCGSKEHTSSNCPHGIFSSKCSNCGSKEHTSSNCPHGIFSSKCSNCGSKNHSTANCPQGRLGGLFGGGSSTGGSGGSAGCIGLIIIIVLALALFSVPFKLIDSQFASFEFKWMDFRDVWVFCVFAWLSATFIFYILSKVLGQLKGALDERFSNAYISLSLFTLCLSAFSNIYSSYRFSENYVPITSGFNLLILGVVYLMVRFAPRKKMLIILGICVLATILPYLYQGFYAQKYPVSFNYLSSAPLNGEKYQVMSESGANLRALPSKKADLIVTVPQYGFVYYLNDSLYQDRIKWYKVQYNDQIGWMSKALLATSVE